MTVHPPKFSVLGDSISTFQGYCPVGAEHYAPDTGAATGCHLVDLAATGSRYTALDAFHPTGEGMRQLAQLWLGAMDGEGAKK